MWDIIVVMELFILQEIATSCKKPHIASQFQYMGKPGKQGLDRVHTQEELMHGAWPRSPRNGLWGHIPRSGSALFIKTKNHVRACPLLKPPCIHFIFAKIKQYTYKSHCFKIHFHMYTRVQKQIQKMYITCVQMCGNAKMWPYYIHNSKSWIFSYKVVT